jgi:membrane associated rhomboid family serine protease
VDLNHILLFIAVVSPLLVLARAWRPGGTQRGWLVAATVVLAITATSWIFARDEAGYVGGGAWFVLLLLPAIGLKKAAQLAAEGHYKSARRLARLLQILHPTQELREQVRIFHVLESRATSGGETVPPIWPRARARRLSGAPAVSTVIVLNIVAFVLELSQGDLNDPQILHRLGALDWEDVVVGHEYWRLVSALFIHAGLLHLGFNLFALYVLGPALERMIGALRFTVCYLLSGLGSTVGVIGLTSLGLVRPAELVGASGCIMGIVGSWAGFLLWHQHMPRAKERLLNIVMIVVIQIFFDLSTPQVSMSAHLCGLLTGFVAALVISPRSTELSYR